MATFISQYWFAIVAIGGLAIWMWRAAGRRRSVSGVDKHAIGNESSTVVETRRPAGLAARVVGVFVLLGIPLVMQFAEHVALVQVGFVDYLIVALIGGVAAFLIVRSREALPAEARAAMGIVTIAGTALGATLGGAALLLVNALLDPGPARAFDTVVATQHCVGRTPIIAVRGAPALPVLADTLRVHVPGVVCRAARAGDTVVVVIGRGFFNRPWIQSARLQTDKR